MAILAIVMGAMRLNQRADLPTAPMFWAAVDGLMTEPLSIGLLYRQQGTNLKVCGAYWRALQTLVGNILILIVTLGIRFTGFLAIDPLLGIAVGLVLLRASWGI